MNPNSGCSAAANPPAVHAQGVEGSTSRTNRNVAKAVTAAISTDRSRMNMSRSGRSSQPAKW
jgi:hypothetical protein